jgi:Gluconate 2-dehydrogenase subunit 3
MASDARISRRSLLNLAARAAAAPGAADFFAAWMRGGQEAHHFVNSAAPPEPDFLRNYKPAFFSAEDFAALERFTEILIPTDDSPGAREARCAHYIDFVLSASADYAPETQAQWKRALKALREAGFHSADPLHQTAIVQAISQPEREPAAKHPAYFAYRLIKRETAFAFFTSRAGMIETLDYRGNSYNAVFPGCNHPEHQDV